MFYLPLLGGGQVWKVAEAEALRLHAIDTAGHRSDVRAVVLSDNDELLLSGSSSGVKIWNPRTTACLRTIPSSYVLCALFAPGHRHAVVGTKVRGRCSEVGKWVLPGLVRYWRLAAVMTIMYHQILSLGSVPIADHNTQPCLSRLEETRSASFCISCCHAMHAVSCVECRRVGWRFWMLVQQSKWRRSRRTAGRCGQLPRSRMAAALSVAAPTRMSSFGSGTYQRSTLSMTCGGLGSRMCAPSK